MHHYTTQQLFSQTSIKDWWIIFMWKIKEKNCNYSTNAEIKCIFCNASVKMEIKSIYNCDPRNLKMECSDMGRASAHVHHAILNVMRLQCNCLFAVRNLSFALLQHIRIYYVSRMRKGKKMTLNWSQATITYFMIRSVRRIEEKKSSR